MITELNAFIDRRLLTTDKGNGSGVISVAHEAFLSVWPPLAEAITANVTALRARRAIEHAATEWHTNHQPPTRLWSGGQLAAAITDTGAHLTTDTTPPDRPRRLLKRHRAVVTDRVDLSPNARDFLHASIRRDRSRRRRTITVLSVLLIVALTATSLALIQQRRAEDRQLAATARQLLAQAELTRDADPRTALQLGLAAHRIDNPTQPRRLGAPLTGHIRTLSSVAFTPDGHTLATVSDDETVILWDLTGLDYLLSHAVKRACSIAGGGFENDEWDRRIPDLPYQDSCPV